MGNSLEEIRFGDNPIVLEVWANLVLSMVCKKI